MSDAVAMVAPPLSPCIPIMQYWLGIVIFFVLKYLILCKYLNVFLLKICIQKEKVLIRYQSQSIGIDTC